MMVALTTICGMVPLALQEGGRFGIGYSSFGLTLIGGMSTSTLLTLMVVPVVYTLIEDARSSLAGAVAGGWARAGGVRGAGEEATEEPGP